jgi:HD superfamily phosphohydrolase
MMFSTVYFHHTTRQFERSLHTALRRVWPDPRSLDPIEEFLAWDDFRVLESVRFATDPGGRAIMDRESRFALVAEFNAERDLSIFETTYARLREKYGDAIWADTLEQSMHRLPLSTEENKPTVFVRTYSGIVDAREASDLIARITGKAHWRKIFVERTHVDVAAARAFAREFVADRSLTLFG